MRQRSLNQDMRIESTGLPKDKLQRLSIEGEENQEQKLEKTKGENCVNFFFIS